MFTTNDLALNSDVYASRLATSFVYGAQMGWFSLAGVWSGPDLDNKCGPMHTLEVFMSSSFDEEVDFLRMLAQARAKMKRYLIYRLSRRTLDARRTRNALTR